MSIITFETYKKAILKKFVDDNNGEKSGGYLYNPTPSKIKNVVRHSLRNHGSESEKLIIADFFKISVQTDFLSHLDSKDAETFKSVQKFLLGKTKRPADNLVEFVAWMIDFQPRPYTKFQKTVEENVLDDGKNSAGEGGLEVTKNVEEIKNELSNQKLKTQKSVKTTVITYLGGVFVIGVLVTYIVWGSSKTECMLWKDTHFAKIDCDTKAAITLDIQKFQNFRRIEADINTAFFDKNAKPLIWYNKNDNQVEFFTAPGVNPRNGKTLKVITETIIRKYVLEQE